MSGLERKSWDGGDEEDNRSYTRIYCLDAPQEFVGQFLSTSAAIPVGVMTRNDVGVTTCSDGYYMAGIGRDSYGDNDHGNSTQVYCAPTPSDLGYAAQFINTIPPAGPYGDLAVGPEGSLLDDSILGNLALCPDDYYMAGLDRVGDRNWIDRTQIYCAPAPKTINPPARACELNSSGPEWTANYKPDSGGATYAYATAVDTAGNIYVTGEAFNAVSANSGLDMFVAKFTPNGSLDFSFGTRGVVKYDNNGNEAGYGVAVDNSGVYVTGRVDSYMMIAKYDLQGTDPPIWRKIVPANTVGRGIALAGGRVYVVGATSLISNEIDSVLLSYDVDGNNPISTTSNISGNDSAYAVAVFGSDIYITGYQSTNSGDMFLRGYSSAGDLQWTQTYDSTPPTSNTDIGRGLSVSDDGTVFVTGYQSSNGGDMFLNAYQATDGAPKWSETHNSGDQNNDVGRSVAASRAGAGRVYVAGSQGTNSDDVFLQEYFSSDYQGLLQNTLVSGLTYQDIAYGIAIGPASENEPVYVSGYRASNGGEAFLNKYSCNAPTGAGATSNGYFTVSPANIYTGTEVRVDATQSGPGISEYEWNWSYSGTPAGFIKEDGGVKNTNEYGVAGFYIIALRITYADATRQPEIFTQRIDVYDNHPPTAAFEIATSTPPVFVSGPVSGSAPLVVTVNGAGSDPDGSDVDPGDYIKNFIWDWGDGTPKGQGQQMTHLYSRPGVYTISLVIEDSVGASNSFSAPFTQTVTVTEQYVCSPSCGADEPVCGPTNDGLATQCNQCLSNTDCGSGYRCLGISCKQGQMCSDGLTECPADGRCPEATSCKAGDVCPDGSACPADGICYSQDNKNTCVLSSDTQAARCYTEGMAAATTNGLCATDLDCTASLQGGTCDTDTGQCRYARCLNETSFTCESDKDCNNSDGICYNGQCDYIYDCAYGPGMGGTAGIYTSSSAKPVPAMPIGIQPDGEACTKPTPDAPNNCEGINGCLYYNYNGNGTTVAGDANNPIGSSVANCLNKFEGGTGCVYYGDQSDAVNSRVSCLPGTDFSKLKSKTAPPGIPAGCVAIDKGSGKKEYDCTGVNNCYYYLNGVVDCDYMGGIGCIYEPNPAGATFCPRAFKTPTGGENFVQCLLNPDATLPSFLLGSNAGGLSTCSTGADCPAGAPICINGTCYPPCQNNVDCVTGGQCWSSCNTTADCQIDCTVGTTCPSGATCQPDSASPTGGSCPVTCDAGVCVTPVINPSSFSCYDTTAVRKLDYGTSPASISVRSSQNASCRWSLFDVSFDQMVSPVGFPLNTSDLINHTASAVGFPPAGLSTIFVECENSAGAVDSCDVPLTLSDPCDSDPDCYGLICNDGWCQAPVCANAQPQSSLPYSALSDGTPISMTTTADSNCVYSNTYDNANQCVAPILSCATAASFATTGGTAHSSFLPGSSLVVGDNYQYVKCQETDPPQSLSTTCTIPVRVLTCDTNYDCTDGWQCVGVGGGPGVCEPPICSGATPAIAPPLPYATIATGTDIGMNTDAAANCRYSENYTDPYGGMTDFANTGGTAHLTDISVLAGWNKRYVKCLETASGEETSVCTIRFNVEGAPCDPNGYACSDGLECRNGRCATPICSGAYPRGRQEVGAFVAIGMNTGTIESECRFADTLIPYVDMTNVFLTLDRLVHGRDGTTQNTVQVQEGNNTKYVACRADAAPNNTKTCAIPFTGGSCQTSFDCTLGMVCGPTGDCIDDPCASSDPPAECFIDPRPRDPCPPFCPTVEPRPPVERSCNTLGYEFHGTAILPSGNCDIVAIILALLSWLAWIVALLAVLSGLRAAYLYITSAGDEKKLRLAYQYLIYTTIGVGVAIITFSLVAITRAILNI